MDDNLLLNQHSAWDYIDLGSSPCCEDCVQVDPKSDYMPAMKAELSRWKEVLEKTFPIPDGVQARFKIRWEHGHDFGAYGEVVVMYDVDDEKALEFALMVESACPESWPENMPASADERHSVLRTFERERMERLEEAVNG